METVRGTVKRVIFENKESGYKVLKTKISDGPLLTITGDFGPEIIAGTVADFHGDYKNHPKYGYGLKSTSYSVTHNAEELASIKIFIDTVAPNIGPERAAWIVDHFGKDTIDVLDNYPDRLQEIKGIGKISAKSLHQAWLDNRKVWDEERHVYNLRAFLNSLGIKERRVKKILNYFGGGFRAEESIRENPYILTEIEGFGFTTADFAARQLGIPESDPLRLKAFIYYALDILCPSYGHLYLTLEEITGLINKYISETNSFFIGKNKVEIIDIEIPLIELQEKKLILQDNISVYSKNNYYSESQSAFKLGAILKKQSDLILVNRELIDVHIQNFERENRIVLSQGQRDALYFFVEKKAYVITGGPGTGKTTVLKAIVELVKKLQLNLTCMTPTGISAKKMAETIGSDAYTIHRRLGFKGKEWLYGEENKYDTDVVIIDESSMVDQETCYRLLAALKDRVHIIFVGDDNQLPSVGAGNVLREIVNCSFVPVVKLEQIFRQAEASDIIKVAHKIKNGDTNLDLFKPDPAADVFFYREKDISKIETFIIKLAQKFKSERRKFQIITPRNQGPLSVDSLNNSLQSVLNPPGIEKECPIGHFIIRRGDRVIIIKNDYELGVYNGEIGKVVDILSGTICIEIDSRLIEINVEDALNKLKLAYTLSVHRCLPGNILINTSKGLEKISGLKKSDLVYTKKEFNNILWHENTGDFDVYKITTEKGYTIETSKIHEFLTADEIYENFKKAEDLKIGSYLCLNRDKVEGIEIPLNFKNIRGKGITKRNSITLPKNLSADISWLFGALIGNGCYTNKRDGIVSLTGPVYLDVFEEARKILKTFTIKVCDHNKKGKKNSIYVRSKNFRAWLLELGFYYSKAPDKEIPGLIFRTTLVNKYSFIAGLIDTDGSVNKKGLIRIITVSKKLAHQIQIILLSCGIISSIHTQKTKKENEKDKICICISTKDGTIFKDYLKCESKKLKISSISTKKIDRNLMGNVIPFGKTICYQIGALFDPIKSRGKKGQGLNSFKEAKAINAVKCGKLSLTYSALKKIITALKEKNITIPENIYNVLNSNKFYDKILSIEYLGYKETMWDMEIEKNHFYTANGFICHNSQGQEYPYIILPFINQYGKNMLQRNLLYTAITRAKTKVIVLGHGTALEKAINNASVGKRNTRLGDRIGLCLQMKKNDSLRRLPEEQEDFQTVLNQQEPSLSKENESSLTDTTEEL